MTIPISVKDLRDGLIRTGFHCCENKTEYARVGCYCDLCVLLRVQQTKVTGGTPT